MKNADKIAELLSIEEIFYEYIDEEKKNYCC